MVAKERRRRGSQPRGDALFGIRSFSVRLGQARVLRLAVALLVINYAAAALALALAAYSGTSALSAARRAAVALAAVATAWLIHRRAAGVAPDDPKGVYSYYMELWKGFYGAYALLPFAR